MAAQLLPIIKAAVPYLTQIATAAIPAFTSKPDATKSDPALTRQIEELQSAATRNAHSVQILAEKMQEAIHGMEAAAQEARQQADAYKSMLYVSLALSLMSFAACFYLLAR